MSYTNRARLYLALSPLLAPLIAVLTLLVAAERGLREFVLAWKAGLKDDADWWYREVYRPARYGSVWDD